MNPELKTAIEALNRSFETFKGDNDKRLAEIEKRGASDVVLSEKVNRAVAEIAEMQSVKTRLDKAEALLARPLGNGGKAPDEVTPEIEARQAVEHYLRTNDSSKMRDLQTRALTSGVAGSGGYTVPKEVELEIERMVVEISEVEGLVTVKTVRSPDYKKNVNKRGLAGAWSAETPARTVQADSAYDQVSFTSGELYGYADVSRWLVEDSQNEIWSDVMQDTSEALAQLEGNAVFSGNGTDKPTGLLTGTPVSTGDAARAFGVLQYFASGTAATLGTSADLFITVPQAVKKQYRRAASWTMNKNTVAEVMKFKDTTGQYLWQPSVQAGAPSMLRGYPVNEIEAMPDIAANAFPIGFGDFKRAYTMIRIGGMSMMRDEVTRPGFIRAYTFRRLGGNKVNSEAVKLVKCAIS